MANSSLLQDSNPAQGAPASLEACPLCSGSQLRWFDLDYRGTPIFSCGTCEMRFVNPQPSLEALHQLYADYDGTQGPDAGAHRTPRQERRRQRNQKRFPGELKHAYNFQLIERYAAPGRLLSIGCGSGTDLKVARARGWQVEGLEIDPGLARQTTEQTGCQVSHGNLLDFATEGALYDCVYMNHVLEHALAPGDWLRKVHSLLSPSGVMWIACPNIDSLSNRTKTLMGRLSLKAYRGKHYASWHHLFFFSPRHLARLLEKQYGFSVIHAQGELRPSQHGAMGVRERAYQALPNLKSCFQLIARKA